MEPRPRTAGLAQWLSNLRPRQNHHGAHSHTDPRAPSPSFWFGGSGVGPGTGISNQFPLMLLLLVQGRPAEKHRVGAVLVGPLQKQRTCVP